ncbi:PipA/GogA/GtgA family type III secretion system effector [Candidatus Arsenophonus nilaparvatae]|uniref:PipA/GogA/GtgA family type III secretion system effector n=1 Tax=Candidatus Arsenophonus nilaparvatae TaxID=1247023 RepID=UPI00068E86CE|nr:PipA/GogA/GtgA family type III secretion system effector [Candidatus Arsenophonus nilaparvatae]
MPKIVSVSHYPATILKDDAAKKTSTDDMLAKLYPDLTMQFANPSSMRVKHDKLATNSDRLHASAKIKSLFISGAGRHDPDRAINQQQQIRCEHALSHIMESAYNKSPTFRRLFNYGYDNILHDGGWVLAADEDFGTTITSEQIAATNGRKIISLNMDPIDEPDSYNTYQTENGSHTPFSLARSFMHEVVHALTMLPDKDGEHERGPVVEYTNIILKEMGDNQPARFKYELDDNYHDINQGNTPFTIETFELPILTYTPK